MKIFTITAIALLPLSLFSQTTTSSFQNNYQVKSNILSPFYSGFALGLEYGISKESTVQISGEWVSRDAELFQGLGAKINGTKVFVDYKKYLLPKDGNFRRLFPFVGIGLKYTNLKSEAKIASESYPLLDGQILNANMFVGIKLPIVKKIPQLKVELMLGGGYSWSQVNSKFHLDGRSILFKTKGFVPRIGLWIGVDLVNPNKNLDLTEKIPDTPIPEAIPVVIPEEKTPMQIESSNNSVLFYGTVTADFLNVRTGPNNRFPNVKVIAKGTALKIFDVINNWYRIGPDEWVYGNYVHRIGN